MDTLYAAIDQLWVSMREFTIPSLPHFVSQFLVWIIAPAVVFWLMFEIPLLLSYRFTRLQGKGKYLQIPLAIWGASYFIPAIFFLASNPYGTVCDLYNKHITPQLMYTDAVAVCLVMVLHTIVEQADMRTSLHATATLFVGTLLPYPAFLFHMTWAEQNRGYRPRSQRWARSLFLLIGLISLLIWVIPLIVFWNQYGNLDLRHSGVGVAPDQAAAWATGVVTVVWFMFTVWALPKIRSKFWSYIFVVLGISHLAFAMCLFLYIRLNDFLARYFLVQPTPAAPFAALAATNGAVGSEDSTEYSPLGPYSPFGNYSPSEKDSSLDKDSPKERNTTQTATTKGQIKDDENISGRTRRRTRAAEVEK